MVPAIGQRRPFVPPVTNTLNLLLFILCHGEISGEDIGGVLCTMAACVVAVTLAICCIGVGGFSRLCILVRSHLRAHIYVMRMRGCHMRRGCINANGM